jgi:hypothetical protein
MQNPRLDELNYSECLHLGMAAEWLDEDDLSLSYAKSATLRWPQRVEVWRVYVRVLINSGKLDAAAETLADDELSEEVRASIESLYFQLHGKYKTHGELGKASAALDLYIRHLCRRIERDPFVAKHLGDALARQDQLADITEQPLELNGARKEYLDLIGEPKAAPSNPTCRELLSESFTRMARLELLQRLDERCAGSELLRWYQLLIQQLHDFAHEDNVWQHAVLVSRRLLDLNYLVADLAVLTTMCSEARTALERVEPPSEKATAHAAALRATISTTRSLLELREELDGFVWNELEEIGTPAWVTNDRTDNQMPHRGVILYVTTARKLLRSIDVVAYRRWAEASNRELWFAVIAESNPGSSRDPNPLANGSIPFERELVGHQRLIARSKWKNGLAVFPNTSPIASIYRDADVPITICVNDKGIVDMIAVSRSSSTLAHVGRHLQRDP